jgi:hypothetical protein
MLKPYKDLSPYEYYVAHPLLEVRNVGWLDKDHEFSTGSVDQNFLKKLEKLVFNSYNSTCNILVNELRGSYECPICGACELRINAENDFFIEGSAELWIPDTHNEENYFATFGLIFHYVKDHHYLPPQEFVDSVLALDLRTSFDGQSIRDNLARKAAGN